MASREMSSAGFFSACTASPQCLPGEPRFQRRIYRVIEKFFSKRNFKPLQAQHGWHIEGKESCVPWSIFLFFFCLVSGGNAMADPLDDAVARFHSLNTYQITICATSTGGEQQIIRYFYSKPGWVRMEFVQPHTGMVLIYDPGARKVRLWPFGVGHAPALRMGPGNPLLRSRSGQRIDRSDVGALLANLQELRAHGSMTQMAETETSARRAVGFDIIGDGAYSVAGVHRYRVRFLPDSLFPSRVESFNVDGARIETVDMTDVAIDMPLDAGLFAP